MAEIIVKQANGLYCIYSTYCDGITTYDMKEEDYIKLKIKDAEKEARSTIRNRTKNYDDFLKEHRAMMDDEELEILTKKE